MKKIGIDARLYYQTGVGVYIKNLLYYLNKINSKNINFIVYVLKKDLNKITEEYRRLSVRGVNAKWHTFSEQCIFLTDLLKDNLDLMHFTYFSYPVFYPKKYISTIHDTTLLNYKTGKASTKSTLIYNFKHSIFKHMFYKQVRKSLIIITPTESVKKQILNLVKNVDSSKIQPIYEGITREYLDNSRNVNKSVSKINYFLYVGTFYPHKNVESLIKAYSKIKTDIKLYLVGPDDFFSKRIENLISSLKLQNKIKIFKKVSQNGLPEFYKNASALVHPSLSEGFGLPIIEAAYFDLPIIASNIDVFNEILQGKFVKFDPNDIDDIKEKIENFIAKKSNFDMKGIVDNYSFENMTIKTLGLYKKILKI